MTNLIKGRYEIVDTIGEGGMATILLAKDVIYGRHVALKRLKIEDIKTIETNLIRFKNEAQIISAVSSSSNNLVHIYDYFSEGLYEYIVMEFVDGENLKQVLRERSHFHYYEACQILYEIAKGLKAIHNCNIVHRDLKPENILIKSDGTIKIADFGISILEGANHSLTKANVIIGSVQYMAPEAITDKDSISKATDIYALGVILYEMITGSNPFVRANMYDILRDQIKRKIPSVNTRFPNIPNKIDFFIQKCTAKNLNNRYKNIDDVINDLEIILDKKENNLIAEVKDKHEVNNIPLKWRRKLSRKSEAAMPFLGTKRVISLMMILLVALFAGIIIVLILGKK
ncbi:hypothetical protein ASO20_00725 [Mycoplasma sp. (ex Biomphalaria glabrata)]|uniref:serine/threonine protein kinase n=1 Tax=Mycoplasma sp. (ex Biomphalaria glabrata) TaxID=1749074 RepID=UPI00073ADFE5|nr:serine/threonine-protein kinase [Mycoplasma sp. (ex Biomphalaria glabrata)]ALV23200.1 hypothetical protein ASO20_00725 [Mycoplasma sp. (ex Biomphalaria glabrata)]